MYIITLKYFPHFFSVPIKTGIKKAIVLIIHTGFFIMVTMSKYFIEINQQYFLAFQNWCLSGCWD